MPCLAPGQRHGNTGCNFVRDRVKLIAANECRRDYPALARIADPEATRIELAATNKWC
jgi:hypothetical protein